METICKSPTCYVGHRSPVMRECSVPRAPWNFGCIFVIEQCSKGQLSTQAIIKTYWIPQVAGLEWKCFRGSWGPNFSAFVRQFNGEALPYPVLLLLGELGSPCAVRCGGGVLWEWGLGGEAEVSFGNNGGRLHVRGERRRQETSIKLFISWIVSKAGTDKCVFTK